MKIRVSVVAALTLVVPLVPPAHPAAARAEAATACSDVPWMNRRHTPEQRARALLAASSQHQKYRWLVEQPANDPTRTTWPDGVTYPVQVPCTPLVIYANGPEGVHGTAGTTAWPAPIAVAATWNLPLGLAKAVAHGGESFDQRRAVVLGPGISGGRTPLAGRTSEYFGEDPLLSGLMAAANVRGLQDGNPTKPVLANLKHYVANEQETDREESSSNVDERTLRQVYDLPYEIAVARGDPGSVMCSYNQLNGVYACENPVLTTNLRRLDGYVMSDFGAVHSTAPSLNAGLDQELNRPVWFTPARLDAALAAGEIRQAQIDRAAFDVVKSYIEHGLFDHPVPAAPVPDVSTPAHKRLAREIAEQSTVLLKNDGVLPLSGRAPTVAVIGPTASVTPTNGVSATTACAAYLVFRRGPVLNCDALVDPLTAITERAQRAGGTVLYDNGADPAAAAAVAARADVAVVFGHLVIGETTDAADLRLDANGDALVDAVAAAARRTVVVVGSGTAVEMPWIDRVDAVFHAWYSGEQGGPALARLLWGDVNPSGKLPMTFPRSLADTPTASPERYPGVVVDGIRQVEYSEGLRVGYRWYESQNIEPLFGFGHGLSYTTFRYDRLSVSRGAGDVRVQFRLTNTGRVTGTEVAQVYVDLPDSTGEPAKRLAGWDRVTLRPGQQRTVTVTLTTDDLRDLHLLEYWDVARSRWTTAPGRYDVSVGGSVDTDLSASFTVRR